MSLILKSPLPEIEIKYKKGQVLKQKITTSRDSFRVLKQLFDADTLEYCESFLIIYLNQANNTIGWERHSFGGLTSVIVDPRKIFATALKCGAVQLILSHNHPSGNLVPSPQDIAITQKMIEGGKLLDIRILDHLIISDSEISYYSFADEGKL